MDTRTTRIIMVAALALTALAPLPARAQAVWRCGSVYQQQPCPGGQAVAVDDARTAQDRAAQVQNVERTARMAETMEQSRVKAEAQPAQFYAPKPGADSLGDLPPENATGQGAKQKLFTAKSPKPPKAAKAPKPAAKKKKTTG